MDRLSILDEISQLKEVGDMLWISFWGHFPLPAVKGTNLTGQASDCDQNHAAYGYSISE